MSTHTDAIRHAISHLVTCSRRQEDLELVEDLTDALAVFLDREDCFDIVRQFAGALGCGHYGDREGRRQLVNCLEHALNTEPAS